MIVGLCGAKRSGKDTVAQIIGRLYPERTYVWSFARDLKISAARALGCGESSTECVLYCDDLKQEGKISVYVPGWGTKVLTGREFLQLYGTEAHRQVFHEDFWVDNLLSQIKDFPVTLAYEERFDLITDVRFPNEAKAILDQWGSIVKVSRREAEKQVDSHASETPLDGSLITYHVSNEGSLAELETNVLELVRCLENG